MSLQQRGQEPANTSGQVSPVEGLWQDLRYSVRMLRKNPAFTAVAVLTLALGIGATTTVYGWVDTILIHPLSGVEDGDGLVAFESLIPNGQAITTSYPDSRDYRDDLRLIAGLSLARHTALNVGEGGTAQRVWGQFVSGNYFQVLGVKAALGRVFVPEEYGDTPGGFPIAVISDRFWRSHFNSDPKIAGRSIRINRHELTIIGVTAPEFTGSMPGEAFDIWIPLVMRPALSGFKSNWELTDRQHRDLLGIARLKPGVTVQQARAEIAGLARQLEKNYPDTNQGISATVVPMWKSHFGPQSLLMAPLQILMGVCGILLLIVCANVANLLLARFTTRQGEFTLRLALGAGRGRLVRLMLTESLVLALMGTGLGVLMAGLCSGLLRYLVPVSDGSMMLDIRPNFHLLAFLSLLCVVTTLLSGLGPALQSINTNLSESLKEGGRSNATGAHTHRVRSLLVISEVALGLVALVGAGLFVRGFRAAQKIDPGFDPSNVLLSQFYSTSSYGMVERDQFSFRLREKLQSEPGVTSVAFSDSVPLGLELSSWEPLQVKGYVPIPGENMKIYRSVVTPGYLPLMRIPIVEGRDFTEQDDEKTSDVMIINQSFAKHFFGDGEAIGHQVHGWGEWITVVGVAKDSKYNYVTESPMPYFYVPYLQMYRSDMGLAFYIRTGRDPNQVLATVRRAIREVDPEVVIFDTLPLSHYITGSLYPQKVAANLLSALGLLALLLTAVGLYSVMSYAVARRTHEIGIRMALGAQRSNILGLVLRQGMHLTFAGLLVGIVVALVLSREASRISIVGFTMGGAGNLLRTGATDPLVYAGAALFLSAIAVLATYIPARQATKVAPLVALRYE
jgi:predicted permease